MRNSAFRNWCINMWYEHKDEHLDWFKEECPYPSNYYFNKYKWWLRREYKHQLKEGKL